MSWWSEALAEKQARQQPPRRTDWTPPSAKPKTAVDWLAEADKLITGPDPATSVEQRFGQSIGADIRANPSFAPGADKTATYAEDDFDRDHERRVAATAVQLATRAGEFGNERAKAAQDQAALVQQMLADKTWTTAVDNIPRKASNTRIAGATWQQ